ncbi:TPA: formate dehydrogenase subunit alpha [bacterium]|nr:formate dehydrogenase subunit alpha [bacterium]
MVEIIIDGKTIKVKEGITILQAAESVGIKIPHLCYHKSLSPMSSCRICLVEVEGARTLVASCSYLVSEGMKVKTDTERVLNARRLAIDLLLSNHPQDCLTCEKNGACKLQEYAYELGITSTSFEGEKTQYPPDTSNPFIERDYSKCILCGRCVKICEEIQVLSITDFANRGFETKISTFYDSPLQETDCTFCGQCVAVCPVGALTEKVRRFKAREWELKKVTTICSYCGCGCTFDLNVKDNEVIKVTSTEGGINGLALCVKGRFGFDFINNPARLKTPLIRQNTKNKSHEAEFKEVSWEEALSLVAERFKEIKDKYGPDKIAGIASARCTSEENYLFQKFMRAVIGTNNVDHCARLCHAATVAGLATAFGSGAMTNSIDEIKYADCILVTGSNTTECHPIISLKIKQAVKNGAKLIVADPRRIELVEWADVYLRFKSGTDVAWLNGMMNVIINENLLDEKFIEERCEGFDEFKAAVMEYSPEKTEEITGIPANDLIKAARIYATAEKASIIYSMGITQHTNGTNNVFSIANLAMLTGNIGRESTGVNPLRGQNNVQGACDMGALPIFFPGYQKVTDLQVRTKFEEAWGVKLSEVPGFTMMQMLNEAGKEIKAMYIMGENLMLSVPDLIQAEKALKALDFLVVQDIFLTETAKLADVILPAVSFAEKNGTFTNTERRVQLVRQAINPIGQSRTDSAIIIDLANIMGYKMHYDDAKSIMEEIAKLTPSYGGISYERLEREGGLQWPCPDPTHPGTKFLHKDKFTGGKGKFHPVKYRPPAEEPDEEYPFRLTTGRMLYHYHGCSMTRRSKGLDEICKEGYIEINPQDATSLGINDGDLIVVSSRRGSIKIKAKITDKVTQKEVFIPFHFVESAANVLTNTALDPIAKIPELKVCAVNISL